MYILAVLPFIAILVYESIYSRLYIDRYYSRLVLLASIMLAIGLSL